MKHGATARQLWSTVIVLALVNTLSIIDRLLPAILLEPIKHDLRLSDTELGLINGFGFLLVYALFAIPAARLADRGALRPIMTGCLVVWSLMTAASGLAQTGWQLALGRTGVALGEAGFAPSSHAFISRNFAPEKRAAPYALLTFSVPVAILIGLISGGFLAESLGWRHTFLVMGAISFAFTPLLWIASGIGKPPVAGIGGKDASILAALRVLKQPSGLMIVLAFSVATAGGHTLATFAPAFLMRAHGMTAANVGMQYGVASATAGMLSLLFTGLITDRLAKRDPRWILWVTAGMMAIVLPFSFAAFLTTSGNAAIVFLAIASSTTVNVALAVVALHRVFAPDMRATASAVLLSAGALLGGFGPLIAGAISDALTPALGVQALGRGLLVVPVCQAIAALLYLAVTRTFVRELVDEA